MCLSLQNKVSSVVFLAGPSTEDLKRLKQLDVENRHTGWLSCCVTEPGQIILKLELKGPDNTLRLRQVKLAKYPPPIRHCYHTGLKFNVLGRAVNGYPGTRG